MTKTSAVTDPKAFGLVAFADLLPARDPIVGEDPGAFDAFHRAMMATLAPATPYAFVIAEDLIAIVWELLQHRRMRDACISQEIRDKIREAVVAQREAAHEAAMEEAWAKHAEAGGSDDDWEEPEQFDSDAAEEAGNDLAECAISGDRKVRAKADTEIAALGLKPVELMSAAYTADSRSLLRHEQQIEALERRRREVKRDFDALQKARPSEATVTEARVIDA